MIFQEPMSSLESDLHHRRPVGGGDPDPPEQVRRGGEGARAGDAPPARDRPSAAMPRQLPAPDLGGHDPAGDDRDGPVLQSDPAHRRRADHRPGRHHSGPDHRTPPGAPAPATHVGAVHHARPGAGGGGRRSGLRALCRAGGGVRLGRDHLPRPPHALYRDVAGLAAAPGMLQPARLPDPGDPRQRAERHGVSGRVRVPPPLPALRAFDLRPGHSAAGARRSRPSGPMLPLAIHRGVRDP